MKPHAMWFATKFKIASTCSKDHLTSDAKKTSRANQKNLLQHLMLRCCGVIMIWGLPMISTRHSLGWSSLKIEQASYSSHIGQSEKQMRACDAVDPCVESWLAFIGRRRHGLSSMIQMSLRPPPLPSPKNQTMSK